MSKKVILVFDIGKTNKKILLFNQELQVVYQKEHKFPETKDDDGFSCDNIDLIEDWIDATVRKCMQSHEYEVQAINFSTYGATLVYLDGDGNRLGPVYNYLKPMPPGITDAVYEQHGGIEEFSRRTASPALGMLNSGMQVLWLRQQKKEIFRKVNTILHFPQYLCYYLTGHITSEYTSIGCHTAIWDFDQMQYHPWVQQYSISLPDPVSNNVVFETNTGKKPVKTGVGIHDSSASLVPYLMDNNEEFVLISTGTWCITMNPFNHEPLTREQLQNDCLHNLSIHQKPVKSSRFFLGHIHDENMDRIMDHFGSQPDAYKKVKINVPLLVKWINQPDQHRLFFKNGMPPDYIDHSVDLSGFSSFDAAYHQFMFDLTMECIGSVQWVIPTGDNIKKVYITGGFAKNEIFVQLLATYFRHKQVYISEVDNSSALGAAMVVYHALENGPLPMNMLGEKLCPSSDKIPSRTVWLHQ